MHDGAHTHHDHHPPVLWTAVIIGLVLAIGSGAIGAAITTLVHILLLTILGMVGLTVIAIAVWLIARQNAVSPYRRRRRSAVRLLVPAPEHPEVTTLRAELAAVSQQLAALQARELRSCGSDLLAIAVGRRDGDGS